MSHEIENAAFAFEPAWHGLGTVLPRFITSSEAFDLVPELGSEIVKVPVVYNNIEVPAKYFTVRQMDNKPLGIVGERYSVMQNRDGLNLLDDLVKGGEAQYESIISLKGGAVVALVVKLNGLGVKVGGIDQVDTYVLYSNSHDGSSQIITALTPIRVVCANTLAWALEGTKLQHKVRHTTNKATRLAEVKNILGMTQDYMTEFERDATRLMYNFMDNVQWEEFLGKLIVIPEDEGRGKTIAQNKHDELTRVWNNLGDTAASEYRHTEWGALQAVSHYNQRLGTVAAKGAKPSFMSDYTFEAHKDRQRAENRFLRTLPDHISNLTNEAHALLSV
jgi:phage/plasmid-like protein (TIGR03299 family)